MIAKFLDACEEPLAYGVNDCCIIAADCVSDHYGFDIMKRWRGRYRTAIGFLRIIRADGYANFTEAYEATLHDLGFVEADWPEDCSMGLLKLMHLGRPFDAPAFYRDGFWHCRTPDGPLMTDKAEKIWQLQR